jgi:hypothetical protein
MHVLDPTNELKSAGIRPAPRPVSLAGKTIGIITNAKEGTKPFFSHLDRLLRQEFGVADVVWRQKSNYSAPADASILAEAKDWNAVITGVGD